MEALRQRDRLGTLKVDNRTVTARGVDGGRCGSRLCGLDAEVDNCTWYKPATYSSCGCQLGLSAGGVKLVEFDASLLEVPAWLYEAASFKQ